MNRLRCFRMAAFCLAILTAPGAVRSAPAPAKRSGLDQVPASAPIVVHVRGVQGTRDRLVTMMEKALPELLAKCKPEMDKAFEIGIQGRKLRGLVKDGPIFLVFTELPKPNDNPPKVAIILAVSNYKEFRDNLLTDKEKKNVKDIGNGIEAATLDRETFYFVDRKGYAVVTPNKDVANAFTKKQPGLNGKLSNEQAAKLTNSDLGVYVAVDALNKEYAEQIKQARLASEQVSDAIEAAMSAIGFIFRLVEDSQCALLTVEFRPGGLAVHFQSEVRQNSPMAKRLEDFRPVAFKDLARMPQGRTSYHAVTKDIFALPDLFFAAKDKDKDSKEAKVMAEAMEELAKAKPSVNQGAYSWPMVGFQKTYYQNPAKAVAAQLKLFKAMRPGSSILGITLKEKPVIQESAQKFSEFQLHSVHFVWDFDKKMDKQIIEALKGLIGDKMSIWFGTDGKSVVQVSAPDWATAQKILDQYVKGVNTAGDVPAFRDVRKELAVEASFLWLVDPVQYLGPLVKTLMKILASAVGGVAPPNWPAIPANAAPSFFGVSVTLQPQRVGVEMFLSAAATQELYKAFIKPLESE